jgi:hypothetical protein
VEKHWIEGGAPTPDGDRVWARITELENTCKLKLRTPVRGYIAYYETAQEAIEKAEKLAGLDPRRWTWREVRLLKQGEKSEPSWVMGS